MADKLTDKGYPEQEWLPAHSDVRQSAYSVAFPRQNPSPALHARALTVDPKSQVVEHWDHSLHSSHMPAKNRTNPLKTMQKNSFAWTGPWYAISSLCSIARTRLIASRNRLIARASPEFFARPTSGCALGPRAPILPRSVANWKKNENYEQQLKEKCK